MTEQVNQPFTCRRCGRPLRITDLWEMEDSDVDVFGISNGTYGCDSMCPYVRANVRCSCGDLWEDGEFGDYEYEDEAERMEYAARLYRQYLSERS